MKKKALELAEQLEDDAKYGECDWTNPKVSAAMIRRLVEELDKHKDMLAKHQDIIADWDKKPLSDEEMKELINNFPIIFSPQDLLTFARAIEERHGIK